jgi:predicted HicB family RNase H-like nuclease
VSKEERRFVVVSADCYQRIVLRAAGQRIPVTMALAEILDTWEPTPEDADHARANDRDVSIWIDAEVHNRLRRAANLRGTSIHSLVKQALESIP